MYHVGEISDLTSSIIKYHEEKNKTVINTGSMYYLIRQFYLYFYCSKKKISYDEILTREVITFALR